MSSYIGDIAAMTSTQSTSSVKKSTDTFGLDMTDFLKMMVAQSVSYTHLTLPTNSLV